MINKNRVRNSTSKIAYILKISKREYSSIINNRQVTINGEKQTW